MSEKEWWDELKNLASQGDVAGFYRRYAQYLEASGIYSESRQAIHSMAIRAAEELDK